MGFVWCNEIRAAHPVRVDLQRGSDVEILWNWTKSLYGQWADNQCPCGDGDLSTEYPRGTIVSCKEIGDLSIDTLSVLNSKRWVFRNTHLPVYVGLQLHLGFTGRRSG